MSGTLQVIKEPRVVRVGSYEDVATVETQRSIVKLLPAHNASIGELASERTFRLGVVINTTRIALCLRIRITDRGCQASFTFGGVDLKGIVFRVRVATKLGDIGVTEVGALLIR